MEYSYIKLTVMEKTFYMPIGIPPDWPTELLEIYAV
jgi:hypothetical protein